MDISKLTIGEAREIARLVGGIYPEKEEAPWKPGETWFFRTVTMNAVGRVVRVTATEIELEDASWVADSGRYGEAIRKGLPENAEIEFVGRKVLGRGAHVDSTPYEHSLPKESR